MSASLSPPKVGCSSFVIPGYFHHCNVQRTLIHYHRPDRLKTTLAAVSEYPDVPGTRRGLQKDIPPAHLLPRHLAVIMDGNCRWAHARRQPAAVGHRAGVRALRGLVTLAREWGIPALTIYSFSSENWNRDEKEVSGLLELIETSLLEDLQNLRKNGIRLRFIGELSLLPESLCKCLRLAELQTADNHSLHLTVALSYSGRQDIVTAMQDIAHKVLNGSLRPAEISAQVLEEHLSTRILPDAWRQPDLIIRTSGEQRISNFLLWESAYSELYFADCMWPDFSEHHLRVALHDYAQRERRWGKRKGDEP